MKRITVSLPTQLANLLDIERRQRDTSASAIVREAVEAYLHVPRGKAKRLPFIGIGDSGIEDTSERMEEILRKEWGEQLFEETMGRHPSPARKGQDKEELDARSR